MTKEELILKLRDLGITSDNCYPKNSFLYGDEGVIGLYLREMVDIFYFYNNYDKKIYSFDATRQRRAYDTDERTGKRLIPLSDCTVLWEADVPFQELPDIPYRDMTLRQYTCIELRIPKTGVLWLDELIRESRRGTTE